jgi:hypothetical protein
MSKFSCLDLERLLREEQKSLPGDDPTKQQLLTFIETVHQMRKRVIVEGGDLVHSGISRPLAKAVMPERRRSREDTDPLPGNKNINSQELINAYETRIRNLERLLQESYAAARGAAIHRQEHIEEEAASLTRSFINNQGTDGSEDWKDAILIIHERIGLGPAPISVESTKQSILRYIDDMDANAKQMETMMQGHIAFSQFAVGKLVLFLPTVRKDVWSIFNVGAPNYYLRPDSLSDLMGDSGKQVSWLLGRIESLKAMVSAGKVSMSLSLFMFVEFQSI